MFMMLCPFDHSDRDGTIFLVSRQSAPSVFVIPLDFSASPCFLLVFAFSPGCALVVLYVVSITCSPPFFLLSCCRRYYVLFLASLAGSRLSSLDSSFWPSSGIHTSLFPLSARRISSDCLFLAEHTSSENISMIGRGELESSGSPFPSPVESWTGSKRSQNI
jgi:hypothetical protein